LVGRLLVIHVGHLLAEPLRFINLGVDEFKKFSRVIIGFDNDEAGKNGASMP
jgi:hypothetical protein